MIRFRTKNSWYEVTVQKSQFHIKKFEAINQSSMRIAVGQTVVSDYLTLEKGASAHFGGVITSPVEQIEDL